MPQTYKRKRSWSRAVFSNLQRKGLEKRFEIQKYVTKPDRKQLAAMLGLTDAQVGQLPLHPTAPGPGSPMHSSPKVPSTATHCPFLVETPGLEFHKTLWTSQLEAGERRMAESEGRHSPSPKMCVNKHCLFWPTGGKNRRGSKQAVGDNNYVLDSSAARRRRPYISEEIKIRSQEMVVVVFSLPTSLPPPPAAAAGL